MEVSQGDRRVKRACRKLWRKLRRRGWSGLGFGLVNRPLKSEVDGKQSVLLAHGPRARTSLNYVVTI